MAIVWTVSTSICHSGSFAYCSQLIRSTSPFNQTKVADHILECNKCICVMVICKNVCLLGHSVVYAIVCEKHVSFVSLVLSLSAGADFYAFKLLFLWK